MLINEALNNEKTALEAAIVVLQNRVDEITFIQRGGTPRVRPSETVCYPTELVVRHTDLTQPNKSPQVVVSTGFDKEAARHRIEQEQAAKAAEADKINAKLHHAQTPTSAEVSKRPLTVSGLSGKDADDNEAEGLSQDRAEIAAEERGERFIAVTQNVKTKRVLRLQKLLSKENWEQYNIQNGTKVYAVNKELGTQVYLGKFSNMNARGMPLPHGRVQFLFKTPELREQYTGQ